MPDPVVIEAGGEARLACVLVHGRGQLPEDLAPLIAAARAAGARVVMPVAEGKSWYKARAVDPMTAQTGAELAASLDVLDAAVAAARADGLPLLLAGFSQGACLSAEWLMRRGSAEAACLLTGARVGTRADAPPVAARPGLTVLATGGDADPWIPLGSFEELCADLHRAGARVRAEMFPGRPHMISPAEAAAFAAMAAALAEGRAPLGDGR